MTRAWYYIDLIVWNHRGFNVIFHLILPLCFIFNIPYCWRSFQVIIRFSQVFVILYPCFHSIHPFPLPFTLLLSITFTLSLSLDLHTLSIWFCQVFPCHSHYYDSFVSLCLSSSFSIVCIYHVPRRRIILFQCLNSFSFHLRFFSLCLPLALLLGSSSFDFD